MSKRCSEFAARVLVAKLPHATASSLCSEWVRNTRTKDGSRSGPRPPPATIDLWSTRVRDPRNCESHPPRTRSTCERTQCVRPNSPVLRAPTTHHSTKTCATSSDEISQNPSVYAVGPISCLYRHPPTLACEYFGSGTEGGGADRPHTNPNPTRLGALGAPPCGEAGSWCHGPLGRGPKRPGPPEATCPNTRRPSNSELNAAGLRRISERLALSDFAALPEPQPRLTSNTSFNQVPPRACPNDALL